MCLGARAESWNAHRFAGIRAFLAAAFLTRLANVDPTFEEGAIFNADTLGDYISGERAFVANVNAITGIQISTNLAENHDLAGINVGGDLPIAANRNAITREVDGPFDFSVNIQGFGTRDLAFDHQALTDRRLLLIHHGSCRALRSRTVRDVPHRYRPDGLTGWRRTGAGRIRRTIWLPHFLFISLRGSRDYKLFSTSVTEIQMVTYLVRAQATTLILRASPDSGLGAGRSLAPRFSVNLLWLGEMLTSGVALTQSHYSALT